MAVKLPENMKKRAVMTTSGVVLCAIAVGFFKYSGFGVVPFQCFAQGAWGRFFTEKASYGTYYIILSGIMLAIDLLFARGYMGIATLVNMFLTGYIVDFSYTAVSRLCPDNGLPVRIVFLAAAVLLMCFASSLYMTSNLGVSVYDAIPIVIANKSKLPFRFVRIGCDLICVCAGTLCGLMPGAGTLVTAFFMGPLIDFFNHSFSERLLNS